ncbi:MAG: acyltransferase family protein [Bradyrhizobium sp.]|uniref:acyltransferase family protein n=1 Tax=Bradyrhizobium sp. TaxID=376 RepID=UPI003D0B935D
MKNRPEIDGLRAVAVVPVILFHAGAGGFGAGFLGVDIFFVISGFLITRIIIDDLDDGSFSILNFYERRARRILPALTLVCLACLPFAWLWMPPRELADFGNSLAAVGLFASNVFFWKETGYFAAAAELKPLLHTWSLAVEEQYYVIVPIALMLLWKLGYRTALGLLVLGFVASLALAEWGARHVPSAAFYLLPTRAWELLIGAIGAVVMSRVEVRPSNVLSMAGLVLVIGALIFLWPDTPTPSLWTLLPTAGTVLILVFGRTGALVARLLSLKPVVGIGLISYSAYLWHQPLLAFARIRNGEDATGWLLWGLIAVTFLLAWASWKYVEEPVRRRKIGPTLSSLQVVGVAAVCLVIVCAAGLSLHSGYPDRVAPSGVAFAEIAKFEDNLAGNYGLDQSCESNSFPVSGKCFTGNEPEMVLWGDSYAMHLAQALASSKSAPSMAQFTRSQCAPFPGFAVEYIGRDIRDCIAFNDAVLKWIVNTETVRVVVISSPFEKATRSLFGRDGHRISEDRAEQAIVESIASLSQTLRDHGKKLVVVSPPPSLGHDIGVCDLRRRINGEPETTCDMPLVEVKLHQSEPRALLSKLGVPVLWIESLTCGKQSCAATIEGLNLYRDSGHLSVAGSAALGRKYDLAGMVMGWPPKLP